MHGCVISTMFGRCFWFFLKTFFFKQLSIPTPPVLHISHSGSLTYRSPPPPWSFAFLTPVLYPVDPPPPHPVLRIFHSDSLTRRSRQVVVAVVDDTYYKTTTTNYISKTSLYTTLLGSFWGNLFSLFQPEIYFFYTF